MIPRRLTALARVRFGQYPIVTVTGPRQSGKTTLTRLAFPDLPYASLEAPDIRARALEDPRGFLAELGTPAVLDEVQRVPDLLSYLQVLTDERGTPGQYVLTGSQNFTLLRVLAQSLAGRTSILYLLPPGLDELRRFPEIPDSLDETLFRGSYPRIFDRDLDPSQWYADYVTTYVERDLRQVLGVADLQAFRTFLGLCAGRSAQLLNLTSLGGDCGIDAKTAKSWITALETSFLVQQIAPLHRNLRKRLVRTPKLSFLDSGLLCHLLGIRRSDQLRTHPLRGAVLETWVVSEILKARLHRGIRGGEFFYRDRSGHEIDLVLSTAGQLTAVEVKSGQTVASDSLASLRKFREVFQEMEPAERVEALLVYGGEKRFRHDEIQVLPWSNVADHPWHEH